MFAPLRGKRPVAGCDATASPGRTAPFAGGRFERPVAGVGRPSRARARPQVGGRHEDRPGRHAERHRGAEDHRVGGRCRVLPGRAAARSPCPSASSDGSLAGTVSSRDIVAKVIAKGRDPRQVQLSELAEPGDVLGLDVDAPVDEAVSVMCRHHRARLPVLEGDRVVGLVTQRDIARSLAFASVLGRILNAAGIGPPARMRIRRVSASGQRPPRPGIWPAGWRAGAPSWARASRRWRRPSASIPATCATSRRARGCASAPAPCSCWPWRSSARPRSSTGRGWTGRRDAGRAGRHPELSELTAQQCEAHLRAGGVGRVVLVTARGPVAHPLNFVVSEGDVIVSTTVEHAARLEGQPG